MIPLVSVLWNLVPCTNNVLSGWQEEEDPVPSPVSYAEQQFKNRLRARHCHKIRHRRHHHHHHHPGIVIIFMRCTDPDVRFVPFPAFRLLFFFFYQGSSAIFFCSSLLQNVEYVTDLL